MQLSRYYAAKVSHILNLKKKKKRRINRDLQQNKLPE